MNNMQEYQSLLEALRKADSELSEAAKVDSTRKASDTVSIMEGAQSSINVLGINAMRPAHEGMESVTRVINNNGNVVFVMMDPFCPAYKNREDYEKAHLGRLGNEAEAAVSDLADAWEKSKTFGNLDLYFHSRNPLLSLVIGDRDSERGIAQVNLYTGKKGVRGLSGKTYIIIADTQSSAEGDAFEATTELFDKMVEDAPYGMPVGTDTFSEAARKFLIKSKIHWLGKYATNL